MTNDKPLVYGHAKDVIPIKIDISKNIYHIHDDTLENALEAAIRSAFLDFRGRCMEESLRKALEKLSSNSTDDELSNE